MHPRHAYASTIQSTLRHAPFIVRGTLSTNIKQKNKTGGKNTSGMRIITRSCALYTYNVNVTEYIKTREFARASKTTIRLSRAEI